MYSQTQIDPVVSFQNAQGETVRATIVNLQRRSLVMEVYNPYSIVQASEVLSELTVRIGGRSGYAGKAVVVSIVNTGLTAVVSATLIDEWRELGVSGGAAGLALAPGAVAREASRFVAEWDERFRIRRDYQIAINETRAYLAEVARWVEQVDLSSALPREQGRLRADVFAELAEPLVLRTKRCFNGINAEAARVEDELAASHRAFAQAALHPLILRAPFVFRTYTKPLGYAGDYHMVNQILDDPRQGPSTYFQIVNAAFLQTAVAVAHRNRIDILTAFLKRMADAARALGRPFRVLNVGCGPAAEVQRFLNEYDAPHWLAFELVDFNGETLEWTSHRLGAINGGLARQVAIRFMQDSVQQLLKRRVEPEPAGEFDVVYCAGLFDYLSDKVCARLVSHFVGRMRSGGRLLLTNVHASNPERPGMEHLLEWYLIHRDELKMQQLLPSEAQQRSVYVDATGVNVFAEACIP
ncbi:SAM-dependent methyltransferase [Massilia sp. Root418]|uniref:class I SAM-dependent methyltransferase n=1 Tax=Massilia sp. Root418 TaxID=1736532 RepID=UPI0006FB330E|nr:class I SAM-dependent methyltransferase [Massilia sp. Root418]KQX02115.1 SAM-dependent methyltransferase [Massilia sp. Root418]